MENAREDPNVLSVPLLGLERETVKIPAQDLIRLRQAAQIEEGPRFF
jgi:hypothetical protein